MEVYPNTIEQSSMRKPNVMETNSFWYRVPIGGGGGGGKENKF